jgi:hypothetical protein
MPASNQTLQFTAWRRAERLKDEMKAKLALASGASALFR